jgi:DNA processing protein
VSASAALAERRRSFRPILDAITVEGILRRIVSRSASIEFDDKRMNTDTSGERHVIPVASTTAPRLVAASSDEFPAQLRDVTGMPSALWLRGSIGAGDALAVALVGARRATAYGLEQAERLAADLARRGVTIVSGLARGIDTAAHRGALRAGGRTIAVLGSGVDVIYPPENRRLAGEIMERGALVSEFAPGTRALPHHFPLRNRVIAGLSLLVVVVEAAEKSGALITAGWAADLGREVMAVPGRVTSLASRGCHRLIKDGAILAEDWEDVVNQLPSQWRSCVTEYSDHAEKSATIAAIPAGSPDRVDHGQHAERHVDDGDHGDKVRLLRAIGDDEAASIEDIIERSRMSSGRASALLLTLELEGSVRQLAGKRFARAGGA